MTDSGYEIVVPHNDAGPVVSVRNILIQSSLATLRENGRFDEYLTYVDPAARDELLGCVAPSWVPVALAVAHYQACDMLSVDARELGSMGSATGNRLQNTVLVSTAKRNRDPNVDLWALEGQIYRMWQRLYQGGSVQVVKLGPKDKLVELRGFPMTHFRYFRVGLLNALTATHVAVGVELQVVKVERYDAANGDTSFRMTW